ncbi:MAG: glutamate 5-kinase [Candidatus Omnitrophica bacterium]|nr:glutamate 5-kinase [Candidatus Omnitrophota bacterium]
MEWIKDAKRIVVKVGTSVLTTDCHALDESRVAELTRDVARLVSAGKEVLLVTSGAIGAGMGVLGWEKRPQEIHLLQAAAAVGQGQLMGSYAEKLRGWGIKAAQILLTREDLTHRKRYLNARQTMRALLKEGVVPVINENDTVSTEEIRFGDNDELSALLAHLMDAHLLVLLTDVDGFEERSGGASHEGARVIPVVSEITPELERLAHGTSKDTSSGGMASKIRAARLVTANGIPMVLANGTKPQVLSQLVLAGKLSGTLFVPKSGKKIQARKRWLVFTARPKGRLQVDAGAREALTKSGRSLLASGVRRVHGAFAGGDLVSVVDDAGGEFARGRVAYSSDELNRIAGMNSSQIGEILKRKAREVIHRDQMVILVHTP